MKTLFKRVLLWFGIDNRIAGPDHISKPGPNGRHPKVKYAFTNELSPEEAQRIIDEMDEQRSSR